MRLDSSPYRPRDSERSVLYLVVDEHLDASLDVAVHHADGSRLPKFVEQELTLKAPWADGTRHLLFEPLELLEKLAAITPRPRINLVLYDGVLAPHARWRARVVAYGVVPAEAPSSPSPSAQASEEPTPPKPPRHWAWANLMRRAFDIDGLACPRCGGRLRLIATAEDPDAIRQILAALALTAAHVDRAPPAVASMPAQQCA